MKKYMVSKVTGVRFDYNEQLLTRPDLYEVVLEREPSPPVQRRRRKKQAEGDSDELDSR